METENQPALHVMPTSDLGNAGTCLVGLYCKEAEELAATILPVTAAVFGDRWLYLVRGTALTESFADPVSGETIVEIRDATAEFADVGASTIELGELLKTVGQLAAHTLGRRYCEGVIDGDVESLIQSLDHVANARVVERILVWLDHPPAEA
jgi:hypothetical protein